MVGNTWNAKRNPCFSVSKKDPKRKSAPALLKSRIATNIFPKSWKPNLKYSRKETPNGFKIKNAKTIWNKRPIPTIFQGIFDFFSLNKKAIKITTAMPIIPLKIETNEMSKILIYFIVGVKISINLKN